MVYVDRLNEKLQVLIKIVTKFNLSILIFPKLTPNPLKSCFNFAFCVYIGMPSISNLPWQWLVVVARLAPTSQISSYAFDDCGFYSLSKM